MAVNTYASLITSGSQAMFALKQALSTSNWKVSGSSDGDQYSTDGDRLTGAIDLENNSAWFTVVAPDDTRQWSFQRGTDNETWTIKRSKAGMSGTVNGTTPPLDNDAATIINNAILFNTSIDNWLISTVTGSGVSSSFYAFNVPNNGGQVYTCIFDEPLLQNTYDTLDQDPYISAAGYNSNGWTLPFMENYPWPKLYKRVRHNMSSPANQSSFFTYNYDQSTGNRWAPANNGAYAIGLSPYSSKELIIPVGYQKLNQGSYNYAFFWGYSKYLKYTTIQGRSNGETLDTGTDYYIYCAGLWMPWDSSTPTI